MKKGTEATTDTKKKGRPPKKVKCGYFQCEYKSTCGKCAPSCQIKFDCDACLSKAYCKK